MSPKLSQEPIASRVTANGFSHSSTVNRWLIYVPAHILNLNDSLYFVTSLHNLIVEDLGAGTEQPTEWQLSVIVGKLNPTLNVNMQVGLIWSQRVEKPHITSSANCTGKIGLKSGGDGHAIRLPLSAYKSSYDAFALKHKLFPTINSSCAVFQYLAPIKSIYLNDSGVTLW